MTNIKAEQKTERQNREARETREAAEIGFGRLWLERAMCDYLSS